MVYLHLFTILLLFIIGNWARERCDSGMCDYHGICTIENHNRTLCRCVPTIYGGKKCETWLKQPDDICGGDGGVCVNYPGGYQCQCKEGYGGQNCSLKSNQKFTNPIILYNPLVELDDSEYVVVFFQDLPDFDMLFQMDAKDRMMAVRFKYSSEKHPFHIKDNIAALATKYKIRETGDLDSGIYGHYVIINYEVSQTSDYPLELTITKVDTKHVFYYWRFMVLSAGPKASFNVILLIASTLFYSIII